MKRQRTYADVSLHGASRCSQKESAFAAILNDLVARVPGARAAALVDRDGEAVDYAGTLRPFDIKVAAAHLRTVLDAVLAQPSLTKARWALLRAKKASLVVHSLPEGYAVVLWMVRGAGFRGLLRPVPACTRRLADEAGWDPPPISWHPIDVVVGAAGLPRAVATLLRETSVEILGRLRAELPEHERAWRVRASFGLEFTLVRESSGFWYADEALPM